MTDERFNVFDVDGTIFLEDHKEGSYHIGKTEDVDINSLRDITKRLNIYADENEQLKIDLGIADDVHKLDREIIDDLHLSWKKLEKEKKELQKENEELKSDNNRLVNETAKVVAEHQRKVLDLIDKSLEKDKQYYKMNYEDYLNGRIEALEELKKELQE